MDSYEPFVSLGVALGIGMLIGLQREQSGGEEARQEQYFLGGARTYPLYALAGAVSGLLARQFGLWIVVATLAALAIPLIVAYADDVRTGRDRGVTSEAAFVLTFLLGVLAVSEQVIQPPTRRLLTAGTLAVAATALLSYKRPLHDLAARIAPQDAYATIKFLILAVIVLPLLPNETIGPLAVLNPFNIGLMIVLMAGIGIVGYVLIRVMGPGRGLGLTGLVGGLVSSTAVTLAMSARARREPAMAAACALGVVLASAVMVLRVIIEVAAVNPALVPSVLWPTCAMIAAGLGAALVLYLRMRKSGTLQSAEGSRQSAEGSRQSAEGSQAAAPSPAQAGETPAVQPAQPVHFQNPFELGLALKFGILFALVLWASKAASVYLGQSGIYIAAILAGLTDMDAITLSMARLSLQKTVEPEVAVTAILLGAVSNTIVKGSMAAVLGGWAFGRIIVLVFGTMLLAGGAAVAALRLF